MQAPWILVSLDVSFLNSQQLPERKRESRKQEIALMMQNKTFTVLFSSISSQLLTFFSLGSHGFLRFQYV